MDIHVGCAFVFDVPVATHSVALVEPHSTLQATVRDATFRTEPEVPSSAYVDLHGNVCRRTTLPPGRVELRYDAVVATDGAPDPVAVDASALEAARLPAEALGYLLPSRYCESDLLVHVAGAQFGSLPAGWAQVQAISDWVHGTVRFDYGASSPAHSAMSVFHDRSGVCRDFAHLGIALCRALNIPARYVCGYLPDIGVPDPGTPMDFCAWMEVYLGDRWYTFDPRNNERRVGRVVVGRGRDAADVAMLTSFGLLSLVSMSVTAEPATISVNG